MTNHGSPPIETRPWSGGRADARSSGVLAALIAACALPFLLASSDPPSATLFNQLAAVAGWGIALLPMAPWASDRLALACERVKPVLLAITALLVLSLWAAGSVPGLGGMAGSVVAALIAAVFCLVAGAAVGDRPEVRTALFVALLVAAMLSAVVGLIQVFAPAWTGDGWIASSSMPGRATGNVRQPNQLATVLLWGAVALVSLTTVDDPARGAARLVAAGTCLLVLMFCVMLSGSRTGVVGVVVLCLWGLVDRRLLPVQRGLLVAAPFMYLLAWWIVGWTGTGTDGEALGVAQRGGTEALTTGRDLIWRDSLALIAGNPWLGVGVGRFNLAWTLTPSTDRWPQFFDHAHNLVLHMLVEAGLPLGLSIVALLVWGLARILRLALAKARLGPAGSGACAVMLILVGLHSMLEYPLWYAHFLLPTAFVWGVGLSDWNRDTAGPAFARGQAALMVAGLSMVLGAALFAWDYSRVSAIFSSSDQRTLVDRIANGQRSWFFGHHADYARITALEDVAPPTPDEFQRAKHFLLDTRLLSAWARAYARANDLDRARWISDRLRELKQSSAEPFFEPCGAPATAAVAFQCSPAQAPLDWRDF